MGRASALRTARGKTPYLLLTTHVPARPSPGDTALRAAGADTVFDVIELVGDEGLQRLRPYAVGGLTTHCELGFWTARDLAR